MPPGRQARRWLLAVATLLIAIPLWAILGYLASAPLGALYGWSGHPPIPAAPKSVYVTLYLVVLPVLSLGGSGLLAAAVGRLLARRAAARSPARPPDAGGMSR